MARAVTTSPSADRLTRELDALVGHMQRRDFAKAMEKAFASSPAALGAVHRRGAKRRGR